MNSLENFVPDLPEGSDRALLYVNRGSILEWLSTEYPDLLERISVSTKAQFQFFERERKQLCALRAALLSQLKERIDSKTDLRSEKTEYERHKITLSSEEPISHSVSYEAIVASTMPAISVARMMIVLLPSLPIFGLLLGFWAGYSLYKKGRRMIVEASRCATRLNAYGQRPDRTHWNGVYKSLLAFSLTDVAISSGCFLFGEFISKGSLTSSGIALAFVFGLFSGLLCIFFAAAVIAGIRKDDLPFRQYLNQEFGGSLVKASKGGNALAEKVTNLEDEIKKNERELQIVNWRIVEIALREDKLLESIFASQGRSAE
jgi:hypothetical protein